MIEYRIRDTSTMLKLFYVIFMNLHRAPYMIPRMRAEADHPQRYTEEQRYSLVQHAIYEEKISNGDAGTYAGTGTLCLRKR